MIEKKNYHDYAINAFRFYAQCGQPTAQQLRALIGGMPEKYEESIADLNAVIKMFARLRVLAPDEVDLWSALISKVYFVGCNRAIHRREISDRIAAAAGELGIGITTAYRILKKIRLLYAQERGLRTNDAADAKDIRDFIERVKGA